MFIETDRTVLVGENRCSLRCLLYLLLFLAHDCWSPTATYYSFFMYVRKTYSAWSTTLFACRGVPRRVNADIEAARKVLVEGVRITVTHYPLVIPFLVHIEHSSGMTFSVHSRCSLKASFEIYHLSCNKIRQIRYVEF